MWRATFFFQVEGYTWTESHYLPTGLSEGQSQAAAVAIANARVQLLAVNGRLIAIRIENLVPPRTVYYISPGFWNPVGQFGVAAGSGQPDEDSAPPWAAVKIRVQGSAGNSSEIYLSGIPEGVVGTGGLTSQNLEPNVTLLNYLGVYLSALQAAGATFRVRNLGLIQQCNADASSPAQAGGLIAVQFPAPLVFGTPPNFGPVAPSLVLKGFRRGNQRQLGLSGVYRVSGKSPALQPGAASPWIYYLANTFNVQPANIIVTGGGCGLLWAYDTFNILNPRGATHRKRGASALAPRGRSRNRV